MGKNTLSWYKVPGIQKVPIKTVEGLNKGKLDWYIRDRIGLGIGRTFMFFIAVKRHIFMRTDY